MLALLTTLFITTNLSIGYTFFDHRAEPAAGDAALDDVLSAEHPALRLHVSVRGHAGLGRNISAKPPLTHFVRIVRAIMLKGAGMQNLQYDTIAWSALMLLAMTIAVNALSPHGWIEVSMDDQNVIPGGAKHRIGMCNCT